MFHWANNGNFPAGGNPWNGQPLRVNPNYTFFTPAQVPTAEEMNFLFGGLSDAAVAGITVPAVSWVAATVAPGGGLGHITGVAWSDLQQRWLVAVTASGGGDVQATMGLGDADIATVNSGFSTAAGTITDCAWDGSYYYAVTIKLSDASLILEVSPGGGSSWVSEITDGAGSATYTDIRVIRVGTHMVFVGGCSSATGNATRFFYCPVGTPSGHTSAGGITQASDHSLCVASNGTRLVVFPAASAGTAHYATTDDITSGVTSRSAAFLTRAPEVPKGLVWSAADSLFILTTLGGDGKTHTYQSADAVTWAEVSAISSEPTTQGLACTAAGCLVALAQEEGFNRAIYSVDAGVTWRASMGALVRGPDSYSEPSMRSSPVGFALFNNEKVRFSHCSGLLPALT